MRILVVEDEPRIALNLKKGLEQEHFAVDVAYDGQTGFDLASSEDYQVIVLDIMLPKMDGVRVCQELRHQKIMTPVLMLTAKDQTQDKVDGLDAGADDYLAKPFAFDELVARVRALMRRPLTLLDTTLTFADVSLNTHTFQAQRAGQNVSLTHKEFALLEYLLRHPQQIVTKDQIISQVWDYDADVLPNTVEVYIRNLRTKIDVPFKKAKPLIHTIRGFGYRLGD